MAKRTTRPHAEKEKTPPPSGPRPFWSGTISFGLVSVPVSLFPAYRHVRKGMRMLDRDGTPLSRRFYCPEHQREVHPEHVLRGYPIDDEYVIVRDDELEALAPEKSRDIDLTKFVPRDQISPALFDRAYFLTPDGDSNKAYRLLVEVMDEKKCAGIATFVMRGKEYLIAIIAENAMLRAETLRFQDEVRSPDSIGLPEVIEPSKNRLAEFTQAIKHHQNGRFNRDSLEDESTKRLLQLVEKKYRQKNDVVVADKAIPDDDDDNAPQIDLLETIRRSMQRESEPQVATRRNGKSHNKKPRAKKSRGGKSSMNDAQAPETKQALYELAQQLDIPGRSQMTKKQLAHAVGKARS